jgi:hypothetical protein
MVSLNAAAVLGALVALSIGTVLTGALGLGWWCWRWEQVIADGFMELRHAPRLWRRAMLGWAVVIVGLIAIL